MIIVFKGHEAERLQHAVWDIAHRAQRLSHAVDGTRLGLKSDLDKIALRQRLGQAQQSAGCGDGLEFRFGAASVFEANRSQDRISKLDREARRVGCGWGKWVIRKFSMARLVIM